MINREDWAIPKPRTELLNLSNNVCYDSVLNNKLFNKFDIFQYPDQYTAYSYLSSYYNIPINNIAIGYGLSELIPRIIQSFTGSISITLPNWQMIEFIVKDRNYRVVTDIFDNKTDMIYIVNPNGVDGSIIDRESILKLCSLYKLVIVDEAYGDFSDQSVLNDIHTYENLIVCKTFSKTIASPGARIGYCFGNNKLISKIQENRPGYVTSNYCYMIPQFTMNIAGHLERMFTTKKYIEQHYKTLPSHINSVFFVGNPNLNCQLKETKPNVYRMALTDIYTFKNICVKLN